VDAGLEVPNHVKFSVCLIKLKHCRTELQLADVMTKALKHERFIEMRTSLNVLDFHL